MLKLRGESKQAKNGVNVSIPEDRYKIHPAIHLDSQLLTNISQFIELLEDRPYSILELYKLGGMAECLIVFDGMDEIPAANVLMSIVLLIGLDVWGQGCMVNGGLRFEALRIHIRQALSRKEPE